LNIVGFKFIGKLLFVVNRVTDGVVLCFPECNACCVSCRPKYTLIHSQNGFKNWEMQALWCLSV